MMKQTIYENPQQLTEEFAKTIIAILSDGIAKEGRASLLVSGGRTPLPLFKLLSEAQLDWSKVDISLVDERWVDNDHEASNEKLVRENLLVGSAAKANFVGLKTAAEDARDGVAECTANLEGIKTPFDVLILGMGEDGHTASLFPCSQEVSAGIDMHTTASYIAVTPGEAPHQRMSLTLKALLNSKNLFLHLTGASKKAVLDDALSGEDELAMPIRAVLNKADVELVWAP